SCLVHLKSQKFFLLTKCSCSLYDTGCGMSTIISHAITSKQVTFWSRGLNMGKPRVAVASLGGTITMVNDEASGSAVIPKLSAGDLLGSVPEISEVADL